MILALYLGLCAIVAVAASQSGRSGVGFFFLSLIFSPLIGFIVLACIGRPQPAQPQIIHMVQVVHIDGEGRPLADQRVIEHRPAIAAADWRALDREERKREWERRFLGARD